MEFFLGSLAVSFSNSCNIIHVSSFLFQAELVALRHDLVEERAAKQVLEKEVNNLLLQLHAVQLQLHSNSGMPNDSENIKNKLVSKKHCSFTVTLFPKP